MKIRLVVAALAMMAGAQSAWAIPPTVAPSPGYDRALAESRRAQQAEPPATSAPQRMSKPRRSKVR